MRGRLIVRLTPADVGSRVTLRLHADGGGFSDVVGRLLAWEDDMLTVERRDGPVKIPFERLAAGRVVPERPPRRSG